MSKTDIENTPAADRSQRILDETPARALTFVRGVTFKPVRAIMQRAGYTAKDHNEGWKLIKTACGYVEDGPTGTAIEDLPDEVAEAVKELDAWDESGFRRARAALTRLHPEQCKLVFRNNLQASTGMGSVMGVMAFLDRLDALESAPDRKATRKEDHAALATLEKRGIGKDVRLHLRGLVKTVQSSPDIAFDTAPTEQEKSEEEKQNALIALRAWFEDWSDTARSVISRRDYLIRLGLAKRRSNGTITDVGDGEGDGADAGTATGSAPSASDGADKTNAKNGKAQGQANA